MANFDKNIKTQCKRKINQIFINEIKSELRDKILQSWLLLTLIETPPKTSEFNTLYNLDQFIFLIVINKNEPLDVDITRFIDDYNTKLRDNFPSKISHIKVLTIDNLENYITTKLPKIISIL